MQPTIEPHKSTSHQATQPSIESRKSTSHEVTQTNLF